jgi:hypothetical protein
MNAFFWVTATELYRQTVTIGLAVCGSPQQYVDPPPTVGLSRNHNLHVQSTRYAFLSHIKFNILFRFPPTKIVEGQLVASYRVAPEVDPTKRAPPYWFWGSAAYVFEASTHVARSNWGICNDRSVIKLNDLLITCIKQQDQTHD